jgi:hypothetical protein
VQRVDGRTGSFGFGLSPLPAAGASLIRLQMPKIDFELLGVSHLPFLFLLKVFSFQHLHLIVAFRPELVVFSFRHQLQQAAFFFLHQLLAFAFQLEKVAFSFPHQCLQAAFSFRHQPQLVTFQL